MNAKTIGHRIKELRAERCLNQSKFGELISVSQDTVSLWENGKAMPTTELIILICSKFCVSADYLLGLDEFLRENPMA